MPIVLQILLLLATFGLVYAWKTIAMTQYGIHIIALCTLVLVLILLMRKIVKKSEVFDENNPWSLLLLTLIIYILIIVTGGLSSPLYFLLYFVSFGIAFVFDPRVVFVFIAGVLGLFLPDIMQNDLTSNMLRVGSLLLISPLAYYFGREFRKSQEEEKQLELVKQESSETADRIASDIEEVLEAEENTMPAKDKAVLTEVLEEAEKLKD